MIGTTIKEKKSNIQLRENGTIKEPDPSDPKFDSWDAKNSMIMSWLLNSIQLEILKTYFFSLNNKGGMGCHCLDIFQYERFCSNP